MSSDVKQNVEERASLERTFEEQLEIKVLDATSESELLDQILETSRRPEFEVRSQAIGSQTARLGESVMGLPESGDYQVEFEGFRTGSEITLRAGDDVQLRIDRIRRQLVFLRPQPERMKPATGVTGSPGHSGRSAVHGDRQCANSATDRNGHAVSGSGSGGSAGTGSVRSLRADRGRG